MLSALCNNVIEGCHYRIPMPVLTRKFVIPAAFFPIRNQIFFANAVSLATDHVAKKTPPRVEKGDCENDCGDKRDRDDADSNNLPFPRLARKCR